MMGETLLEFPLGWFLRYKLSLSLSLLSVFSVYLARIPASTPRSTLHSCTQIRCSWMILARSHGIPGCDLCTEQSSTVPLLYTWQTPLQLAASSQQPPSMCQPSCRATRPLDPSETYSIPTITHRQWFGLSVLWGVAGSYIFSGCITRPPTSIPTGHLLTRLPS